VTATQERAVSGRPATDLAGAPSAAGPPARGPASPAGPEPGAARATRPASTGVTTAKAVATSVLLAGALILGFGAYLVVLSPVQQARAQENLYQQLNGELGLAVTPVAGVIPVGTPVALLEIPRLGVAQVVVEGTSSGVLMAGPGHRRDTPLPGQAGAAVLLGRSGLFGAPFSPLGDLRRGDVIVVTTGQARSTFAVVSRRDSTQAIPPPNGAAASLVLSTASPPLAPDRSLIVTAVLTSELLPGRVDRTAITEAERSLTPDSGAALPVMLWTQALVGLVVATSWAYLRWLRWPAYLISTPILLAILWNLYENVAKLLPNTM